MGRPKGSKNKVQVRKTGTGTGTGRGRGKPKGTKNGYTMSDKAVIVRGNNTASTPALNDEEKSLNARIIQHSLQCAEISKNADINNPESLLACFHEYLKLCLENGMRIGNMGAISSMGINASTLSRWKNGTIRADDPRYRRLAEYICNVCSTSREQLISDGKINPVIGIFWQRNFDGLRNDTEQQQSILDNPEGLDTTSSEYVKKYGQLIDE